MDWIILDRIQGHAPRTEGAKYGEVPPEVMLPQIQKHPRYEVKAAATVDHRRKATRLQVGHEPGDVHQGYGERAELRRRQCQEPANFELPKEIEWEKIFNKGLDFEAMASKPRKTGRPKKKSE